MRKSIAFELAVCDNCGLRLVYPAASGCPDVCPQCLSSSRVGGTLSGSSNQGVAVDAEFSIVDPATCRVDEAKVMPVLSPKDIKKAIKKMAKDSKKK